MQPLSFLLVRRVARYLVRLFGWQRRESVVKTATEVTVPSVDQGQVEWNHDWSLRDLLSELDTTFGWLEKRIHRCSNLRVLRAAKTLGPYMVHDVVSHYRRYDYCYMGFPAVFFLATKWSKHAQKKIKGLMQCCAVLAVRRERLSWEYEKLNGVPYDCSLCFEDDNNIQWFDLQVVINRKTGAISFPRSYYRQNIVVHSNGAPFTYTRPVYGEQSEINIRAKDFHKGDVKKAKNEFREWVAWCLNTYVTSETACQIIVKKDNRRATFTIPQERVVSFFRHRDKVAVTPTGKRRTIFHLVRAHYRRTRTKSATVVNHARGVRHFLWNGYDCTVFAHGWHGDSLLHFQVGTHDGKNHRRKKFVQINVAAHQIARVLDGRRARKAVRLEE